MSGLVEKVRGTIIQYNMIAPKELVIVGVSGGPDSLALLYILNQLKNELGFRLHVAHLNHSFRGEEARKEAVWVKETAENWGLTCSLAAKDVPALARTEGLSPQDAGHLARKEFFLGLKKELAADKIALGHHADDQAETLLLHFLTGTGPEGMRGIMPVNGPWIRPLLFIRRAEIETFCQQQCLDYREDPSNKKNIYLRNRIRNELLPWLVNHINPNLVGALNRTARIFWAEEEFLQTLAREAAESCLEEEDGKVSMSLQHLVELPLAMQRRVIRHAYGHLRETQGLPFFHVEEVLGLAAGKQVGKVLHLPEGVVVEKGYDRLEFYPGDRTSAVTSIEVREVIVPGSTFIPETDQTIETNISASPPDGLAGEAAVYLPFNGAPPLLYARSRRAGDRFSPAGLKGTKKLKDYFIDKKIPRKERDSILLISDENEVLWIPGLACGENLNKKGDYDNYLVIKVF